jgi:hypothetical protein
VDGETAMIRRAERCGEKKGLLSDVEIYKMGIALMMEAVSTSETSGATSRKTSILICPEYMP